MVWGMATSLAAFQVHLSVQLLTCLSDRCAASLQSGVRSWMTPSTWMMTLALWGTFVSHAEWLSLMMQRDKKDQKGMIVPSNWFDKLQERVRRVRHQGFNFDVDVVQRGNMFMSVLPAGFKGRWFTNEEDVSKTCFDPRAQGCMNHGFMLKQFAARGLYTTSSWSWMELHGTGSTWFWWLHLCGLGDVGDEAEELRDLQCFLSKDHSEWTESTKSTKSTSADYHRLPFGSVFLLMQS